MESMESIFKLSFSLFDDIYPFTALNYLLLYLLYFSSQNICSKDFFLSKLDWINLFLDCFTFLLISHKSLFITRYQLLETQIELINFHLVSKSLKLKQSSLGDKL